MTVPLVLFGPTAGGKSAVAVALAERAGAEIVSMDALSVYRRMDVGTAKPAGDDRARVPHHCIDLVEPWAHYDVGCWVRDAQAALDAIAGRGHPAIVCGGTGLYLRACERGLAPGPAHDPAMRAGLLEEAETLGAAALHARLRSVDPESADRIHPNDLKRITRALEVHALTGRPLSEWHAATTPVLPSSPFIVLNRDDDDLRARVAARTDAMLQGGLVAEVRTLLDGERPPAIEPANAVGYREAIAHIAGDLDATSMRDTIVRRTWRLARRQRTWARSLATCTEVRIPPGEAAEVTAGRVAPLLAP